MKFCTRIFNVKRKYKSAIRLDESVFMENYFTCTPSNIDLTNFSESFITTVTRKLYSTTMITCLKWTFHLFLQHENFLTQTPCRIFWDYLESTSSPAHLFAIKGKRKRQFLKLLRERGCTLVLPKINKTGS